MRRTEGFLSFWGLGLGRKFGICPPQTGDDLQEIMDGEVVPPERRLHYDWEFHFALVRACNSRHMIAVFQNVYEKYIGYQLVLRNYRWAKALEEHQLIFEAALARDAEVQPIY